MPGRRGGRRQPGLMVTDFLSEKPEFPTADADSIERMVQLRAALVVDEAYHGGQCQG
jgi:hypothetical protein